MRYESLHQKARLAPFAAVRATWGVFLVRFALRHPPTRLRTVSQRRRVSRCLSAVPRTRRR